MLADLVHLLAVVLWNVIAFGGALVAAAFAVVLVTLVVGDECRKFAGWLRDRRAMRGAR